MSLVCRFLLRWRVVGYSGNIQGNCMNHILETQKPVKEGFLAILQYYQGWYHRRPFFLLGGWKGFGSSWFLFPSLPGHWIHQIPSKVPVECTLQASRLKKSADFSYDRQVWSLSPLEAFNKRPWSWVVSDRHRNHRSVPSAVPQVEVFTPFVGSRLQSLVSGGTKVHPSLSLSYVILYAYHIIASCQAKRWINHVAFSYPHVFYGNIQVFRSWCTSWKNPHRALRIGSDPTWFDIKCLLDLKRCVNFRFICAKMVHDLI